MPRLSSTLQKLDFGTKELLMSEYRRDLAHHRRLLCSHTDKLTVEVPTFLCASCFGAKVDGLFRYREPDVQPETWKTDMANALGDEEFNSPRCQSCRHDLHGEALYVETPELSERLGIPDETSAIEPSKKLRNEVLKLYERKCFACGSKEGLKIDHILRRSRGGKAAFANLQPLCRKCNDAKANRLPRNIVLFTPPTGE
jgi:hypothetical protein